LHPRPPSKKGGDNLENQKEPNPVEKQKQKTKRKKKGKIVRSYLWRKKILENTKFCYLGI